MAPLDGIRRFLASTTEMSSSSRNQNPPPAFPALPPTLSAQYDVQAPPHIAHNTAPTITPYLGLRSRLSQVWLNRWTVLLLLVLVRTLLAIVSLNINLASAKREALSACTDVEDMGSVMASMPHYMAAGINELTASGVEKAVDGLMSMLLLTVTGVEELVVFYINMLTQTYVCLITFTVTGSLHVALKVVEDAESFLNETLANISSDIKSTVSSFQDDLNSFADALNSIPSVFGSDASIPTLNISSSLSALSDITLPSDLNEGLDDLNNSIPTFSQVNNFTQNAIRFPFDSIKTLINDSIGTYKFDRSIFPVPQKEQLSFCSGDSGINDFFNDLNDLVNEFRKIFIIVLVILAVLVMIPMAYREIRRWRSMQKRVLLIERNQFDPFDVTYLVSRPYTGGWGVRLAGRFGTPRRQILVRWFVAYATSTTALFVLSLGVAGLLSCLCQYILLKGIQKEVPALASQVGEFAEKVVETLNNTSIEWAAGVNEAIESTNSDINEQIFGWVNTSTTAINNTINTFVSDMNNVLNDTFGGTVLYAPIQDILYCLIGIKVESIQDGLTWVSDHAHIDFPLVPDDVFSMGAAAAMDSSNSTESFLADPDGETQDKITDTIARIAVDLADGICTEAIISAGLILVWVTVVLLGLIRACYLFGKRDKTRGEGGPSYAMNDIPRDPPNLSRAFSPSPRYSQAIAGDIGINHRDSDYFPGAEIIDDDEEKWQNQKLGFAGQRHDAKVTRPNHQRVSSHGEIRIWEKM